MLKVLFVVILTSEVDRFCSIWVSDTGWQIRIALRWTIHHTCNNYYISKNSFCKIDFFLFWPF